MIKTIPDGFCAPRDSAKVKKNVQPFNALPSHCLRTHFTTAVPNCVSAIVVRLCFFCDAYLLMTAELELGLVGCLFRDKKTHDSRKASCSPFLHLFVS